MEDRRIEILKERINKTNSDLDLILRKLDRIEKKVDNLTKQVIRNTTLINEGNGFGYRIKRLENRMWVLITGWMLTIFGLIWNILK